MVKDQIEADIKKLVGDNSRRSREITMHGQIKEQLINEFMETQGAIKALEKLIAPKPHKGGKKK